MIRINLLPQKRGGRVAAPVASQRWLVVVMVVVALEMVLLFVFHRTKTNERDAQLAANARITNDIEGIKKVVSNHEDVKKTLAVLRAREDAIANLQKGRSGPTAVLLELAQLLTLGKGPSVEPDRLNQLQKDNPNAVFNASWDSRRLWLTSYAEAERTVTVEGLARDPGDGAEFARRLVLSPYFYEVKIQQGKREIDSKTKLDLARFSVQLKVRY